MTVGELKRRLYMALGVDKPWDELWRALLTLEGCGDVDDREVQCEDCPIAKELSFQADTSGVWVTFTTCGLLQALSSALEQEAIGVRNQEVKQNGAS